MDEKKLRQTIGSRTRARRKELKLTQGYLAEKMDVNKSTIQRYEKGTIDNTKKLIVEGLASALYVTPEYLRGETDTYESGIQNKRPLEILDAGDWVADPYLEEGATGEPSQIIAVGLHGEIKIIRE